MSPRSVSLPLLKEKIQEAFGKHILSHKECLELSQDVYNKTGTLISVNTLRRLFGLIKGNHLPSFSTQTTLAEYCGYNSLKDLRQRHEVLNEGDENPALLQYIVSLFKNTVVPDVNDSTYINLVRHTVQFLNGAPKLVEPFQRAIAKTKNGQDFYFEQFINLDKLNGFYGDGLKYYLVEKTTNEAQLFGNALLALRYYLTAEGDLFAAHVQKVKSYELTSDLHPFVSGRYFGTLLLAAKSEEKDTADIVANAKAFYTSLKPANVHVQRFPSFEATFCTSLLLAEEYGAMHFYADRVLKNRTKTSDAGVHQLFAQTFHLYKAIALWFTGQAEEAGQLYDRIDPNGFYFLSKRFLFIFYTKLGQQLRKLKNGDVQLDHLIAETGFVRLQTLMN